MHQRPVEAKQKLNNSYGSKLDSANLLILGMEGLLPDGAVPVSRSAIKDAGTEKDAVDRQIYGAAVTRVVLYAIVVELVVKHIWEQQQGKTTEHHHDVHRLFKELNPDTQCHIVMRKVVVVVRGKVRFRSCSAQPGFSGIEQYGAIVFFQPLK